jgi:fatty-acyl-CoA synthase
LIVSGPPSQRYHWQPVTIAQQLERTAVEAGGREALIAPQRRLTWGEVRDESRDFAKALLAAGVDDGDHVAIWLPNQLEWVLGWFATAYIGAVVIPLNSRYKADEVSYILRQSDSKLLLMRDTFLGIDFVEMLDRLAPPGENGRDTSEFPELDAIVALGDPAEHSIPFRDFLAERQSIDDLEIDRRRDGVSYDRPTIIVYTSGTTGHPKGAVHSHRILRNECSIAEWMDIGPDSRILGHMPFFHVAGGFTGILPALIGGGALVLMDHWDVSRALKLIVEERITSFSGIPTHFIDLLNHPDIDRVDTSSLHSGWIGGASNPPEVIDGAINRLGMDRILPVYGMTETTSVTTFPRPHDPREIVLSGKGVPVSDFELKVVDLESGEELGSGAEGEICVRGHCLMQGYYRNEDATTASIDEDGWFHSGDLGVIDENGYLGVTGRKTDMFIVGGANAYPAEIELALSEHPDVVQAYVVGAPDPRLGEVGFAFVQRRPDSNLSEQEVKHFCRGRLADFKVPRYVRFVDELPMTATGKIQRFRLRETAAEHTSAATEAAAADVASAR